MLVKKEENPREGNCGIGNVVMGLDQKGTASIKEKELEKEC
jgi:hypothetical protein